MTSIKALLLIALAAFSQATLIPSKNVTDFFKNLSDGSPHEVFTGYIPVRQDNASSQPAYIFYQLNSARNSSLSDSSKPLILWMQGGPGCSGLYGLYSEIGPFKVKNKTTPANTTTQILVENPNAWSLDSHMVFVDQPIGVAYSILGNRSWPNTTVAESFDFENFLVGFFAQYPFLKSNDFYIFSESYGGHYVPAFAAQIIANQQKNQIKISGIGVGDGLTDFLNQMVYSSATYSAGIVSTARRDAYKNLENLASAAILNGNYNLSTNYTEEISGDESEDGSGPAADSIPIITGINPLNFAQYPPPGDSSIDPMTVFLNNNNTKDNLGVPLEKSWAVCANDIYRAMWADISFDFKGNYTIILENTRVLIYTGQNDMAVPTPGTLTWMEKIKWRGINDYKKSPKSTWKFNGNVVGSVKKSGNLTRAIVYNAGHGIPHDRPDVARDMLLKWLYNTNDWSS